MVSALRVVRDINAFNISSGYTPASYRPKEINGLKVHLDFSQVGQSGVKLIVPGQYSFERVNHGCYVALA